MSCDSFLFLLVFVLQEIFCMENNLTNGCGSEISCLKCSWKGCIKCQNLIVYPTRRCVQSCPFGHKSKWSTLSDYMGRICVHNGNPLGLSPETISVITGIVIGAVLSAIIITLAVVYIKLKRGNSHLTASIESSSDVDDSPERRDFLKQLESLRPYAQNFLDMLNDTRKQLRDLHKMGDNNALAAYKPVVRDLAKILLLLNRSIEKICIPDDWEHLLNWAEKALKRWKKMSDVSQHSQPQVAQLINFLQGQGQATEDGYSPRGSTTMSTFKPDQFLGSTLSLNLHNAAINHFNYNYDSTLQNALNPQWKFEYSLVGEENSSEFNPVAWRNSKEYLNSSLFLDDDFCQLGFRPQDEITTEL